MLQKALEILNRDNFSKIQERVNETNNLLQFLQVQALQNPSPLLFEQEREIHKKWLFLREIEEYFFRQKSKINWLQEGDQNTSFFHRICQACASYNSIRSFFTLTGIHITDPVEMSCLAVDTLNLSLDQITYFTSITTPLLSGFKLFQTSESPQMYANQ